jgi:ABC-type branched-subunit amino acid transport system ATPase component
MTPLVDRVIAIELGALLAEGTMSEVLANEDVRASYLGES